MLRRIVVVLFAVLVASPLAALIPLSDAPTGTRVGDALLLLLWVGWWLWPPGAVAYAAVLPRLEARAQASGVHPRAVALAASPLIAVVPLMVLLIALYVGVVQSSVEVAGSDLQLLIQVLVPALVAGAVVPLTVESPAMQSAGAN